MASKRPARPSGARHRRSATPSGHWPFVILTLVVMAAVLVIEGYSRGAVGETPQSVVQASAGGPPGPTALLNGGPVIGMSGQSPFSYRMRPKTVALTFDDGPDPTWTPRILAVLGRYHVPATFFTVGAHVASHPDLVQAELNAGDEVGSHTYTHISLATAGWREPFELTLTQNALAGAAGIRTTLLRPPYCGGADGLSAADWAGYQRAARLGYLIVLDTVDTEDWTRPGVRRIVRNALPQAGQGAIVMMHDSGGDRSETVAALPGIITELRARGYSFVTVTDGLRLPNADVAISQSQREAGLALVIVQQVADRSTAALALFLIIATGLILIRLLLLVGFAISHRRRERRRRQPAVPRPGRWPGVSVVVPAYNEAAGIAATIRSLVASDYRGDLEVIVVDDGSSDDTAAIASALRLPNVLVIRQPNGGKPSALNRGIAVARHDLCVLVDADTIFEPDAVTKLVLRFADPRVGAVSGNTKVANRKGMLGRWQHLEYVMGFNLERRMYDILGTMPTVPGAIGAFRRQALAQAGWVSSDTLAEDTDLTMAVVRAGWKVVYEQEAIAWTEVPATLRQLWRQRYRWSYGTLQAAWKHRRSLLDRGASGKFGRRTLAYLLFFQFLLPVIAPVIDLSAIYGFAFLGAFRVGAFLAAFIVLQMLACAYALRIDGERMRAVWSMPLQQLVYRQLIYLVTIQSVVTALTGTRHRWQTVDRSGVFSDGAGDQQVAAAAR